VIRRILVWDAPTRVFHWLQVLVFGAAYLTAFSERLRNYHVALGYILLGLLVFRLLWGFVGTNYARFRTFFFTPHEVIAYLRSLIKRNSMHYLGHNPAGSIAIWLLLMLGMLICVTGVLALQDEASDLVIEMHGTSTYIMLGVVLLHLIGVLMSSILNRENLALSMLTGFKLMTGPKLPAHSEPDEGIRRPYNWLGVLMVIAVVVFWFAYVRKPFG